ncbi:MAG TPA: protein kinase, partial [Vicinamibacteria bacterium]
GEVYEAKDRTLDRRVAVKRIRLDAFAEGPELEEVKARFLREAQVAAKLRHPNVVTIHDIAARGHSSFMVMELVEGRTLQSLLRERGRLGLEETLGILSQAAAALDYAHGNGVVHRDVKPANLMIEPSGHVKVMDFGIAKAQSSGDITRTGTILGTPNYMSPEQAQGGTVDGRADLFSLGCILYECLTGQKPFAGDSVTAILLKILKDDPPAIAFDALKLPVPIGDVVRRALSKEREARYATGQLLMDAIREAVGRPVGVGAVVAAVAGGLREGQERVPAHAPSGAAAPASPRSGRGRTLLVAAAVVAAAALAVAGLLWTTSASPPDAEMVSSEPASPNVRKEEPGIVGRLMGARPRIHVTVPETASLDVRLETPLSSETARAEEPFTARTTAPLVVDGLEAVPDGSRVLGHVAHAAGAGKVSGRGQLTLEFDRIVTPDGEEIPIEADPIQHTARSTVKKDAKKIAGGAALGALVGGLFGGKKGAAIGAAAGGSAGTGVVLATKGDEVVLPEGTALEVRLRSRFTVTL